MITIFLKVFSSNLTVLLLKLVTGFLFPKWMSTEEYAKYQLFLLYISYIGILHLGFPTGMYINYAGIPYSQIDKKHFKREVQILLWVLIFFSLGLIIISSYTSNWMTLDIGLCVVPYCFVTAFQSLYQAWGDFNRFSRMNVALSAIPILTAMGISVMQHSFPADHYIVSFGVTYFLCFSWILCSIRRDLTVRSTEPVCSEQNWMTLKLGFSVCIGNYVNVLFHSVDKQFVAWLFTEKQFAGYAFGLSLQNLMMVFITSLAQPMIHFLAVGKINESNFKYLKSILLSFGSFSGLAYFASCFVITLFLPNYAESTEITRIYFWTFPAVAMINCVYINLYRWQKKVKRYIAVLTGMLVTAVLLNTTLASIFKTPSAITIATAIVYAIWLMNCSHDFPEYRMTIRDWSFIISYSVLYMGITAIENIWLGVILYTAGTVLVIVSAYWDTVEWIRKAVQQRNWKR